MTPKSIEPGTTTRPTAADRVPRGPGAAHHWRDSPSAIAATDAIRSTCSPGKARTRGASVLLRGMDDGDLLVVHAGLALASVLPRYLDRPLPTPINANGSCPDNNPCRRREASSSAGRAVQTRSRPDGCRARLLRPPAPRRDGRRSWWRRWTRPRMLASGRPCGRVSPTAMCSRDRIATAASPDSGDEFDRAMSGFATCIEQNPTRSPQLCRGDRAVGASPRRSSWRAAFS